MDAALKKIVSDSAVKYKAKDKAAMDILISDLKEMHQLADDHVMIERARMLWYSDFNDNGPEEGKMLLMQDCIAHGFDVISANMKEGKYDS